MNIQRVLRNIGLDSKEIKIYLALLKLGTASVADISKESHLKRTTVYPFLYDLQSKGLIELSVAKYNKMAKVREPKQLLRFAKAKERKYGRAVLKLRDNLKDIKKHYIQDLSDVEVKYYEGVKECRNMLLELYKIRGKLLSYSSWMKYPYIGEQWCENFYDKLYLQKKFTRNIQIVSATEHNLWHAKEYVKLARYNKRYFFKFIPPKREFIKVDIFLFNNIKMILSFKGVKPNGIYIKNRDLVQSDKAVFRVLYSEVALEYENYLIKHKIDKEKLRHL